MRVRELFRKQDGRGSESGWNEWGSELYLLTAGCRACAKKKGYEQGVNIWLRTGCDLWKADGETAAFAQHTVDRYGAAHAFDQFFDERET